MIKRNNYRWSLLKDHVKKCRATFFIMAKTLKTTKFPIEMVR